jgi:prepilin-type N-terminal cleavage/methylation domain-containing protein
MRAIRSERGRVERPERRGTDETGPRRSDQGFTLVELMIGVMLSLVILLACGSLYVSTERSFQTGSRKLLAQQEATLLSTVINRRIRAGAGFMIYQLPDQTTPADSGNGLALYNDAGALLGRLEWNAGLETMVDSAGARITSMRLTDVLFLRDPAHPRAVSYRFKVDDEKGNLVDIESAAALRN